VTFDGRQPGYSEGVTLPEAAWFLSRIGVRSAINLDGGSSATFVVKGTVVNHPSDRYVMRNGRLVVEQYAMRSGDRFVASIERSVPVVLAVVKR
jgi:exopolysaccharide biosynthesis protein